MQAKQRLSARLTLNERDYCQPRVKRRPAQVGHVLQPGSRTIGEQDGAAPVPIGDRNQARHLIGAERMLADRLDLFRVEQHHRVELDLAELAGPLKRDRQVLPDDLVDRASGPAFAAQKCDEAADITFVYRFQAPFASLLAKVRFEFVNGLCVRLPGSGGDLLLAAEPLIEPIANCDALGRLEADAAKSSPRISSMRSLVPDPSATADSAAAHASQ